MHSSRIRTARSSSRHGGVVFAWRTSEDQSPPPEQVPPEEQNPPSRHPLEQTPPAVDTPGADTQLEQGTPPGADTPLWTDRHV